MTPNDISFLSLDVRSKSVVNVKVTDVMVSAFFEWSLIYNTSFTTSDFMWSNARFYSHFG